MRIIFLCMLFIFVFFLGVNQAIAQLDNMVCGTTSADEEQSYYGPPINVVRNGGKRITNQGTLRVLVVYVRFQDDTRTDPEEWPDYNVLPSYAQFFVDPYEEEGGADTLGSMSDFIDRASGGNGAAILGALKVTGEVYYVTTDQPRSAYTSDNAVHTHVFSKLDDPNGPYRVNFALYDNWTFMSGGYFVHTNVPDGNVDWIFMNWRDCTLSPIPANSPPCNLGGVNNLRISPSFVTNDVNVNGQTIQIRSTSGASAYRMYDWGGPFDASDNNKENAIYYPGEEFFHYMYGGTHLDQQGFNVGNVQQFSLMTANAAGHICAYERYRAGWLSPTIIEIPTAGIANLEDTHINNKAVMIPIRKDVDNNIVEYFLIENYHTFNDYSTANPFLERSLFARSIPKGLLVYHIEDENLTDAMNSHLDIECADGLWQWSVVQGASTPPDRTDDLIDHVMPAYNTSDDDRDQHVITVGSVTWTDYFSLWALHNIPCYGITLKSILFIQTLHRSSTIATRRRLAHH